MAPWTLSCDIKLYVVSSTASVLLLRNRVESFAVRRNIEIKIDFCQNFCEFSSVNFVLCNIPTKSTEDGSLVLNLIRKSCRECAQNHWTQEFCHSGGHAIIFEEALGQSHVLFISAAGLFVDSRERVLPLRHQFHTFWISILPVLDALSFNLANFCTNLSKVFKNKSLYNSCNF